ncbi:TonB-dependent receptor [Campylobacter sp. MIT 99-7217]|uniref:TonB-dependent receptor plug domain-containing protein n=1 Tax=Campylobacter sp. MIT 99-7217 TaxID=535091 RepID=UPI00115BEACF|nr:TonB-dependent receptor [Campylobacter sp. MIT 99-7217]TQR33699.1 TonB-dependent receptor [Campylobacter sp. MIT 99-7217]
MRKLSFIALLSLCAFGANEDINSTKRLEASFISADRSKAFETPLKENSKSISVIKSEELLQSGGTGAMQSALEKAPSIVFVRQGSINGQISVRGMSSQLSRSIIALDGVRITGRNTLELNLIDPNSIDSVEIIRGSASSLYGSHAINGVVNFKSRRYTGDINKPFSLDTRIRALEFSSVNKGSAGRLEILGGGDGFDALFGLHGRTGESFRTPLGPAKGSDFHSYGFDFNLGYTNDNDIRFYSQGRFQRSVDGDAGGQFAGAGSDFGFERRRDPNIESYLRLGLEAYDLGFVDKLDYFVYYRRYNTDLFTRNASTYTNNQVYNNNFFGARLALQNIFETNTLSYGLESLSAISPTQAKAKNLYTQRETIAGRKSQQHTLSAFVKDDLKLSESFFINASLRDDFIITKIGKKNAQNETPARSKALDELGTISNNALTGSLGFVYFIAEPISLVANISQNFKSPEAAHYSTSSTTATGKVLLPNPNLKNETARSYEAGIRFEDEYNFSSLNFYQTDYKDMLITPSETLNDPQYPNGWNYSYINIGKAMIRGVELQGEHKFMGFTYAYNATYTYAQDKTNDKPLSQIAPLYGRLSLAYDMPWGYVKFQERAYKGKTRVDRAVERKSKSYALSDLYLGLNLGFFNKEAKNMQLIFGVENIFDKLARNPVTQEDIKFAKSKTNPLLEPGRNFFIKYGYNY